MSYCVTDRYWNDDDTGSHELKIHEKTPEWGARLCDLNTYYSSFDTEIEAATAIVSKLEKDPDAWSSDEEYVRELLRTSEQNV